MRRRPQPRARDLDCRRVGACEVVQRASAVLGPGEEPHRAVKPLRTRPKDCPVLAHRRVYAERRHEIGAGGDHVVGGGDYVLNGLREVELRLEDVNLLRLSVLHPHLRLLDVLVVLGYLRARDLEQRLVLEQSEISGRDLLEYRVPRPDDVALRRYHILRLRARLGRVAPEIVKEDVYGERRGSAAIGVPVEPVPHFGGLRVPSGDGRGKRVPRSGGKERRVRRDLAKRYARILDGEAGAGHRRTVREREVDELGELPSDEPHLLDLAFGLLPAAAVRPRLLLEPRLADGADGPAPRDECGQRQRKQNAVFAHIVYFSKNPPAAANAPRGFSRASFP